ncbi:DNA polymerase III subunit gamma/tau [Undibacterium baiyunense]|uniref:DNA-directed DNA polymerase n=1 Tax=Undibacterium baiyunense TaxID=2828731 RepID=A0A941DB05_9BURK|nr:DNA polymerase III subunit gamma/tau [Undibacterium baiyunense]MBR7744955.1 DNA polymerase III subunit gamma/tau [Undibacterium baiyunense]
MSYQVLARKYRPKSFDTLVGQEHVVRALTHALDQQRLHHAYLFTGTRGVGKTTLSRILAKSFNCEKGITAQPCGQCDACTSIDAGRFVDYIEMDAASNRGVDEMASLLEQAIYAPSNARFKVYMIDEVHMLTNHAFNSMLKTLEEPPEHVKFILATTDPQKIPVTVLSRCLQFNLKQMPPGHIVGHLENILGQEQIDFEVAALRLLAQGAHGSMRDALSLTDQAIAYAAGKVSLDAVQSMLGALDQSYLIRLLDALVAEDGAGLLAVADEMSARSLSYKAALQDLGSMLHQIAIAQMVPAALADDLPERTELLRLAQSFNKEEVQLYYQIAVHGRNEIGLAPDEYAGFSMTLLRMLAFRPSSIASMSNQGGSATSTSRPSVTRPAATTPMSSAVNGARPIMSSQTSAVVVDTAANSSMSVSVKATTNVSASVSENLPTNAPIHAPAIATISPASAAPAVAASTVNAPAVKPMSPAMAALAAARAASGKKTAGSAISSPSAAAMPKETPELHRVESPVVVQETSESTATKVPELNQPESLDPTLASNDGTPAYVNDNSMPPPWDEIDSQTFDAYTSQASSGGRRKEIQESDYWKEDSSGELNLAQLSHPEGDSLTSSAPSLNATGINPPVLSNNPLDAENVGLNIASQEFEVKEPETQRIQEKRSTEQVIENNSVTPSSPMKPLQLMPMAEINWDGHWPNLAASLPVRGVAQQLAQQSELRQCLVNGNAILFKLCVPLQTLLSAGSGEKLSAALNERFAEFGREIRLDFEIGAVAQTANAQAVAERAERQVQAEQAIQSDSFVQALMREFGATILTGSVRPI